MKKIRILFFILGFISLGLNADPVPIPEFCLKNVANFDYELQQNDSTSRTIKGWGPTRARLQLSSDNINCLKTAGLDWQRQRILAAADFWIKQKLNYCHHYLPNYETPIDRRDAQSNQGGYCSAALSIKPNSVYYQQPARWNYNGKGTETLENWVNHSMWHGMDCSNYTTFLYNFAFGSLFSSQVNAQAGQGYHQEYLSPNQQKRGMVLNSLQAAGQLVCRDNSLEVNHSCKDHGGYLSVFDNNGMKHPGSITSADLAALPLQPGDLLFIAASRKGSPKPLSVTHVVMWTGKKVGYGPNDIPPEQIAPNSLCSKSWMPKTGDWVITDSHYQGPDYRIITPCFYLNNLWGVRRIIR